MRPESPGSVSLLRRTAAEASTQITLEATRAIAALTRRTHRMAFSCQRGRVLRRFRQNACRVDTQNAQNADFLSTRPRCCRWNSEVLQVKRWSRLSTRRCAKARQNAHPEMLQHAEKSRIAAKCSSCGAGTHFVASGPSKCSRWKGNASGNSPPTPSRSARWPTLRNLRSGRRSRDARWWWPLRRRGPRGCQGGVPGLHAWRQCEAPAWAFAAQW